MKSASSEGEASLGASAPRASWIIALLLVAFAGSNAFVLLAHRVPRNADQAVVGLMARHILESKGHPVFYYGATYAGALEPHYVALIFALLGSTASAYRFAMMLLVAATIAGVWVVTRRFFGPRSALFALAYLAVPPFFFLYKGLTSDGAYDSVALLTLAEVGLALWIDERGAQADSPLAVGLLGVLFGLGFWVMPHTAAVSAVVAGWLLSRRGLRSRGRSLALIVAGGAIGASPWWIWNLRHGWASLKAPELGAAGWGGLLHNVVGLARVSLPALEGAMYATADIHSVDQIFPLARLLAVAALIVLVARPSVRAAAGDRRRALLLLALAVMFTVAAFSRRLLVTEPRYLFAYYVLAAPLLGAGFADLFAERAGKRYALAAAAALLIVHAGSLAYSLVNFQNGDGLMTGPVTGPLEPLIQGMEKAGVRHAYADYWTAYRVSFESGERIIATPLAGARYNPYTVSVDATANPSVVLIDHPDACFQTYLSENGLAYRRSRIGGFAVYTDLAPSVLGWMRHFREVPLPTEAYRVGWRLGPQPRELRVGIPQMAQATFTNLSRCIWPPSVHLGYHWWPLEQGLPAVYDGERGVLEEYLVPGQPRSLSIRLVPPPVPGRYRLEYDLVHELVKWFSDKGGQTASVEVQVRPSS